jgi:uncharacterized protein (TIGR02646 family)
VIYIAKPKAKIPPAFVIAAKEELKTLLPFFANAKNGNAKFEFKAYKHKDLKKALEELFLGKCAYCEAIYGITGSLEVEHYRPKSIYYWLAADWSNLLPSCKRCNNGKLNKFPLKDPRKQARRKGDETREDPLLLNPSDPRPSRHPEKHLTFDVTDGSIQAAVVRGAPSPLGEKSIEVYRLRHVALSGARRDWAARVQGQLLFSEAARQGRLTAAQKQAADQGLIDLLRPGQPFRALTMRILRERGITLSAAKRSNRRR